MSIYYPILFSLTTIIILTLMLIILLGIFNRRWWKQKWVRTLLTALSSLGIVCVFVWNFGYYFDKSWIFIPGVIGLSTVAILEISLIVSLPFSSVFNGMNWLWDRIKLNRNHSLHQNKFDKNRRLLLSGIATAFPLAAVSSVGVGITESFSRVRINNVNLYFDDLPSGLDNLKILQISDSHLGYFVDLEDLNNLTKKAMKLEPHLVLVTGDVADHLKWLSEALGMILQIKPKYGTYACLGNHEYYRGIEDVKKSFKKMQLPLLINSGTTLNINGSPLYLAGADDPIWIRKVSPNFYYRIIPKCLKDAPANSFKLLMCHRPDGFDAAAEYSVDLTLSGHTHGGQISIGNRKLLAEILGHKYIRGHYLKSNGNQLYVSSGVGEWFPFRLNCPPEAPLFTLKSRRRV